MSTHSIHHVTAVTAKIAENLAFYTQVLGLRLVKRSVNQDDVSAYHLFYADAVGSPGTDMTFFDWPTIGQNIPGSASIAQTTFRAPEGSLDWWYGHLQEEAANPERFDEHTILFADHEGQRLELVDNTPGHTQTVPWTKFVDEANAIRGIVGVNLNSARPDSTEAVLTQILGYEAVGDNVFETQSETHFARVRLVGSDSHNFGRLGAGGTHHVAFRVDDELELLAMAEKLNRVGLRHSGVIDRYYFKSLYFREPGGILFEMATDGPGFASDEPMESLGEKLALPPFLEARRTEIEAGLKPLPSVTAQPR